MSFETFVLENGIYAAALNSVPAGISITVDPSCADLRHNPVAAEFLRIQPWDRLSHSSANPPSFKMLDKGREIAPEEMPIQLAAWQDKEVRDYELECVWEDGVRKTALWNASPLKDDQGKIIGAVATFKDITEQNKRIWNQNELLKRQASLLDLSTEAIFAWDLNGAITYWNKGAEKMYGFSSEEAVGRVSHDLLKTVHPIDIDDIKAILTRDRTWSGEIEHTSKDGRKLIIETRHQVIQDESGNMTVLETNRDITERKRAEMELSGARNRLATELAFMNRLHRISTLFLSDSEISGMLGEIVDAAIAITGADMGNIQLLEVETGRLKIMAHRGFEQPFLDFFNAVEEGRAACGTALHQKKRVIIEDVTQSPIFVGAPALQVLLDAGVRAVQSTPLLNRSGQIIGMLSTHYRSPRLPDERDLQLMDLLAHRAADIIEHIQTKKALQESLAKLEAAFACMTDAVFISDIEGNFIDYNDAFATYHRFKDKAECLKTLAEYPDILDVFMANGELAPLDQWAVPRALRGETVSNAEYGLRRKDTGETWVGSYNFAPIRDKEGTIVGSVVTGRDITEQKRAEKALRKSEERYRRLNEELEQKVIERTEELTTLNKELNAQSEEMAAINEEMTVINEELTDNSRQLEEEIERRKESELELQASEERFRTAIENMQDCFGIYKAIRNESGQIEDFLIEYVNEAYCQSMLVTREDQMGKRMSDLYPNFRGHKHFADFCRVVETGESLREDNCTSYFPNVIVDIRAVKLGDGFSNSWRDVTKRVNIEEELLRSENQLRLIMDTIPSIMTYVDADRRYKYVNKAFAEWHGINREDALGKHVWEVHGEESYRNVKPDIDIALSGKTVSYETELLGRDGEMHYFYSFMVPEIDDQGTVRDYIALSNDMTEFRVMERRIADALEFNQRLLDSSPVGISIYDSDGQWIYVNDAGANLAGGAKDALMAMNINDRESWQRNGLLDLAMQVLETGVNANKEIYFEENVFGNRVWFECNLSRFTSKGEPNLLIIYHDITERKLAEEKISKLNLGLKHRADELTKINKELESFSYSISHDLRAPLRAMNGFSQMLFNDYYDKLDDEGKKYLQVIRSECNRMSDLINGLLNLSRLSRKELKCEELDLSVMAETIAAELQRSEPERQVEFAITPEIKAYGDKVLLQSILQNFLDNAWKFTSKHDQARIVFGITEQEGQNAYFIRDDGAGFDMRYADKLFGTFQRIHGVDEFPGNGIGLAIIQRIVHHHGGQVWAEGEVEKGATFYFTLNEQPE